ncbi:peptidoglycan D,D-transpeptidase FtsI family protein [Pradoshia sp.]|uniref:peptidoglycan D,D-transpeptidase FtsI family protein n=1 Tax=Pradoshia sp. TaxID=2651281 RepID=UPI003F11D6B5
MNNPRKRKKKKRKPSLAFRTNILLFTVFLLFTALILRLGILQIVHGDTYKKEVEKTEDITVNKPVPRGLIYDRNYHLIVDNEGINAITYTRSKTVKTTEMIEVAEKLSKFISINDEDMKAVKERDMKDFWILLHPEEAKKKITKAEYQKESDGELESKDLYKLQLDRITEKELASFSKQDLKTLAIFRKFNSGTYLTPEIVKNKGVTDKEMALVSENLDELPGVDTYVDWNRKYPFDSTLKSILGRTSSANTGLPKEKVEYYTSRGYSLNERIGLSNLELYYEDILHGQKGKFKTTLDKAGNIIGTESLTEGQRGKDLALTIDINFQKKVETIIENELKANKGSGNTKFLDRAFVVAMDPNTGEILALAGKRYSYDEEQRKYVMNDFAQGTYTTAYAMGSSVKGATILTGYQEGVISPGTVQYDAPIKLKDTNAKKSYTNMGPINDLTALKRSSNVYMFKTAIAIGGTQYTRPEQTMNVTDESFDIMRNRYAEFGLGKQTGIDLPGEQIGYKGSIRHAGLLMDFSIGQYDTYTPLQLAQYVSTIANGGYRMEPHIVKKMHEPVMKKGEIGPVFKEIAPKSLNKLSMKDEWIKRVQEGFRQVTQDTGGTAASFFANRPYKPAGKTGTAQAFYDGPNWVPGTVQPDTWNLTFVSYAPYDNPEIAISVVVPWAYQSSDNQMNKKIAQKVYDAYFNFKGGQ